MSVKCYKIGHWSDSSHLFTVQSMDNNEKSQEAVFLPRVIMKSCVCLVKTKLYPLALHYLQSQYLPTRQAANRYILESIGGRLTLQCDLMMK